VVSKEDLIILKAISFRDIDKHDIRNILNAETPIDWAYLEKNFKALKLDWEFIKKHK
jgi:ribosome-associated toxin RatA of RatAB toxin-antitoxin module